MKIIIRREPADRQCCDIILLDGRTVSEVDLVCEAVEQFVGGPPGTVLILPSGWVWECVDDDVRVATGGPTPQPSLN